MSPFFGAYAETVPQYEIATQDHKIAETIVEIPFDPEAYRIFSPRPWQDKEFLNLQCFEHGESQTTRQRSASVSTLSSIHILETALEVRYTNDPGPVNIIQAAIRSCMSDSQTEIGTGSRHSSSTDITENSSYANLPGSPHGSDDSRQPLLTQTSLVDSDSLGVTVVDSVEKENEEKEENEETHPPSYEYAKVKTLGQGGEGTCTLISHQRSGQLYALKTTTSSEHFPKDGKSKPLEAHILSAIGARHHNNITQLHFAIVNRSLTRQFVEYYFEYYPLGDLYEVLARHQSRGVRIPESFVRKTFLQLASVLEFLHRGYYTRDAYHGPGVVHRDLKPENILLRQASSSDESGLPDLVLGDFGSASFEYSTYTPCGTDYWKGPEVPRASPKGDVWSLGAIIHQMVHFQGPIDDPPSHYPDDKYSEALWYQQPKARRVISTVPEPYSNELRDAMLYALKPYESRPDSRQLLMMVEKLLKEDGCAPMAEAGGLLLE